MWPTPTWVYGSKISCQHPRCCLKGGSACLHFPSPIVSGLPRAVPGPHPEKWQHLLTLDNPSGWFSWPINTQNKITVCGEKQCTYSPFEDNNFMWCLQNQKKFFYILGAKVVVYLVHWATTWLLWITWNGLWSCNSANSLNPLIFGVLVEPLKPAWVNKKWHGAGVGRIKSLTQY